MKKLQFKLEGKQMLTKEQMKKVSGGEGPCSASCWVDGEYHEGDDVTGLPNCQEAMGWCQYYYDYLGEITQNGCSCTSS